VQGCAGDFSFDPEQDLEAFQRLLADLASVVGPQLVDLALGVQSGASPVAAAPQGPPRLHLVAPAFEDARRAQLEEERVEATDMDISIASTGKVD
jgi:hypothetical protein